MCALRSDDFCTIANQRAELVYVVFATYSYVIWLLGLVLWCSGGGCRTHGFCVGQFHLTHLTYPEYANGEHTPSTTNTKSGSNINLTS